ncbi:META domain-containing protein [Halomonas binhaiensis]|uniref:META domain-containing protein n=1 Tax=Halomonas binhaiensis TaxID=2562282 RepID=A0A5C1NKR6_9GAMM|nr:META domain-containing protein [Halomonas binhaiensis]QEM82987.1 META domain-containing protein [Halomonas binhaiensis]
MKGISMFGALLGMALFCVACTDQTKRAAPSELGALPASYLGQLPCDDCKAIRYELSLFDDDEDSDALGDVPNDVPNDALNYVLKRVYLGPGELRRFHDQGQWAVEQDGLLVMDVDGQKMRWQIEPNGDLILMKTEGDDPEPGARLSRLPEYVGEPLENRYWRLIEIQGKAVSVSAGQREPYLVLRSTDMSLTGSGGCQWLSGSYQRSAQAIEISPQWGKVESADCPAQASTQQQAFIDVLQRSVSWRVLADRLNFRDSQGDVVARFEVVHL